MTAMTVQAARSDRITADAFLSGDYPIGSELVDGVVHVMDPAFLHQEVAMRLLEVLRDWSREQSTGRVGYGGNWVLSDGHVYKPDVWWAAERPRDTRHLGPPELAIEVRSPGTWALDVGPKLRRYEEAGAAEVWLVDPTSGSVLVFRRQAGEPGFADAFEIGQGETLVSPLLPGFALDVDALFADLE